MIRDKRILHNLEGLLPELKEKLEEERDILFAYLFGSLAKGRRGALSDIDIALYLEREKNKEDLYGLVTSCLKTDEVDLVILNNASLSLQYNVVSHRRLLFSRDERRRIKFEARVLDLYLDTLPLRRMAERFLQERMEKGRYGY